MSLYVKYIISGFLDPTTIEPPPDYKLKPRPRTSPFWQAIVKRNAPGPRVDKVYLDCETTKTRWFSKAFQWTTVAKDLVVEGPSGRTFLPIQPPTKPKHSLLQLADLFIYSNARAISGREVDFGEMISDDVFLQQVGEKCDEVVRGMPDDLAAYRKKISSG